MSTLFFGVSLSASVADVNPVQKVALLIKIDHPPLLAAGFADLGIDSLGLSVLGIDSLVGLGSLFGLLLFGHPPWGRV